MTSAAESFVIALARASKRGSWHLRGLRDADREDVTATAMAWCWENRASYDPQHTLEAWFDMALKEARSKLYRRGKSQKRDTAMVTAKEFNEHMAESLLDPTAAAAEAQSAARELMRQLEPAEREQIPGLLRGSREPTLALSRKLVRLRRLLPNDIERRKVLRANAAPESDSLIKDKLPPRIDREIGRLSLPPVGTKDCPVCWRCSWYYALLPKRYTPRTTVPGSAEVQWAIWHTEQRKILIAQGLQNGTLHFTGANAR